ncbi:MAG: hypothetical protein ACFB9M_10245 [Myxococcota bacterium]
MEHAGQILNALLRNVRYLSGIGHHVRRGRAAWGESHNRLLAFGAPPLPLVRRVLLPDTPKALF